MARVLRLASRLLRGLPLLSALLSLLPPAADSAPNILWLLGDNLRPSLGCYGHRNVLSPNIDALAAQGTLFSRAYCQLAWCAPSRNSFLTGRRPYKTHAWGFDDSFRRDHSAWVTLPGYFKQHGYFVSGAGKTFHPDLPPNYDYPESWSRPNVNPDKPACRNGTMTCAFSARDAAFYDADRNTTQLALAALDSRPRDRPFLVVAGLQAPRLPWSYPEAVAQRYPPAEALAIAAHPDSPARSESVEWFRPNEVDLYDDIRNVTHATPMAPVLQHQARLAYYSTITHVDDQVGVLLRYLNATGLSHNTTVVFSVDHGQALGERNLWSMMALTEAAQRVPLIISRPKTQQRAVADAPVELVDLFPTLVALAGLPAPPAEYRLDGRDISRDTLPLSREARAAARSLNQRVFSESVAEAAAAVASDRAALGEITRCHNCTEAYGSAGFPTNISCTWDADADADFYVPCCKTPREKYELFGVSIRTSAWRYVMFCPWNGTQLQVTEWGACAHAELYDHRNDTALYDVDATELQNIAGQPAYAPVEAALRKRLAEAFQSLASTAAAAS